MDKYYLEPLMLLHNPESSDPATSPKLYTL